MSLLKSFFPVFATLSFILCAMISPAIAQQVSSSQPTKEAIMMEKIHWLGHSSFRIDAEKTIYLDPWKLKSGASKADIILITHDHYDHCSPSDVAAIQKEASEIVCGKESLEKFSGSLHSAKPGASFKFGEIKIEAVRAYNVDKKFHPRKNDWVGYIITIGGVRIYHAGDTDFIPEMKDIKCDIALLPVSGTYVMTAEEAVKAVALLKPKFAVPIHWGEIVGSLKDAEYFKKNASCEVRILKAE